MAISDRINEMYTHVGDVYDTITNVDLPTNKNIQNIPSTIRKSYLDIMNNGIDKIWNNWEKVTGEGETLTLNSTEEAPMKINLKGNTSQETTTGKNKLDLTRITARTIQAGITITPNFNGNLLQNIRISGTPTTSAWQTLKKVTLEAGSYILTGINISNTSKTGLRIGVYIDRSRQYFINANSTTYSFTLAEQTTMDFVVWVQNVDYYPSGDIYITPMIRLSSVSDATYEPYTNGASPNPDYPQDVEVVTGDNTIKVEGKNLLPTNASYWESGHYDTSGAKTWFDTRMRVKKLVPISPSTTYYVSNALNKRLIIREYNANKEFIYNTGVVDSGNTFTTQSNTYYLGISIEITYSEYDETTSQLFMCNNSVVDKTYEPYQSASYPINLGVENLWKNQLSGFLPQTGDYPTTNSSYPSARYVLIPLIAGQSITLSGSTSTNGRVRYIDKSTNQIVGTISQETNAYYTSTAYFTAQFNNGTITANKEFIVGIMDMSGNVNDLVVNYGTRPSTISDTPIELCKIGDYQDRIYPLNGKWYLEKKIVKVELDGTRSWQYVPVAEGSLFRNANDIINNAIRDNNYAPYCNYYKGIPKTTTRANNNIIANVGSDYHYLDIVDNRYTNATDFRNWQTTAKPSLYYILATPTYTEITGELLNQLEAIKKSYTNQTNISQENNDKPFILDVTALKQLTQ